MHFLYIIQSQKSGKYYVGITADINRRIAEHNNPKNLSRSIGRKKNSFTAKHRPWELLALYQCADATEAAKMEQYIKQQKSQRIILHLCNPELYDQPLPLMMQKMKKVL